MVKRAAWKIVAFASLALAAATDARAHPPNGRELPFNKTLSNLTPLAFGMNADEASAALGTQLYYLRGRPGDEILLAIRTIGGGGFFPRDDRLYLQFRRGRLTGFKGDWGRNWMWR